ncbi:MAG: hypothetical protein QFB86_02055 [Patescibacteria group bacterium]|nr:hypothetical protein [Patescibacteria group bacterium]
MKHNAAGFSTIEGLLLAIAAAIILSTGLYVHHVKQVSSIVLEQAGGGTKNATANKIFSTPSAAIKYSNAPADLQEAILSSAKVYDPNCVVNNVIVDFNGLPYDTPLSYNTAGFAQTAIGCRGGAEFLYAKQDNIWKEIERTQSGHSCDVLKQYKVPVDLLSPGNSVQCYASDHETALRYTGF